jgi:hypothetical protein
MRNSIAMHFSAIENSRASAPIIALATSTVSAISSPHATWDRFR